MRRSLTGHSLQLRPMQEGLAFRSTSSIGVVVRRGANNPRMTQPPRRHSPIGACPGEGPGSPQDRQRGARSPPAHFVRPRDRRLPARKPAPLRSSRQHSWR
jgi:hypothetical protein